MRKDRLLIYDRDEDYICHLAEWINRQEHLPFLAQPFTDKVPLEKALDEEKETVLLVGEVLAIPAELERWREKAAVMILEDRGSFPVSPAGYPGFSEEDGLSGHGLSDKNRFPRIGRYQSAEKIVRNLMEAFAAYPERKNYGTFLGEAAWKSEWQSHLMRDIPAPAAVPANARILGVYSPLGRCGKTAFSLCLGQIRAKQEKTLYLNLENYSGFRELVSDRGTADLSDLMYFLRRQEGNLFYKLNAAVRTWKDLDYILPPFSFYDLAEIQAAEWKQFFMLLAVNGEHESIILDIGSQLPEVFSLLAFCSRVYVPVLEDPFSRAKVRQFQQNFRQIAGEGAAEKVQKVSLPHVRNWSLDEAGITALENSSMGEFVRKLLREEKMYER